MTIICNKKMNSYMCTQRGSLQVFVQQLQMYQTDAVQKYLLFIYSVKYIPTLPVLEYTSDGIFKSIVINS